MQANKAVVLFKIESTYGVDAAPVPGTDALLTGPVKLELETGDIERKVVLPYGGKLANIPKGQVIKMSFSIEVFGSGVAITPPKHGPILRTAGFAQTIGADNVSYDETSVQDVESATIYFYEDGVLYKALGCVCASIKGDLVAKDPCPLECSFEGMWGGQAAMVSDVALPSPTFGALQTPPAFQSASFTIDAYAGIINKLGFGVENKVIRRPDANSAYGIKRLSLDALARKVSGGVDPEVVALAAYNPWDKWQSATVGQIAATLGSAAGNRMVLTIPNAQKAAPKLGEREGVRTYDIDWEAVVTLAAGNNRIQFKFN